MAEEIVANHRRRFAGQVERVIAQTTKDLSEEFLTGALHEEAVVALGAVDPQRLNIGEVDRESGSEYAFVGNDEIIAKLGAGNNERVEAVPAVDIDRGIDRVLHQVGTRAAGNVGALPLWFLRTHQSEGPDLEAVVALIAIQRQHSSVMEHHEAVLAQPPVDGHRLADAVREKTPGGFDGGEHVAHGHVGVLLVALRAE